MDKIQRATEIHRSMTPHQMALYIVDIDEICTRAAIRINELLKERNATGVAIDSATRGIIPEQHPMLSRLQMIANMAKRITELEDEVTMAEHVMKKTNPMASINKFAEYNAKLDEYDKRITELQDALELAEEAVRAKQPEAPEGWQAVPIKPTEEMLDVAIEQSRSIYEPGCGAYLENPAEVYMAMLAAAPKLGGE